MGKINLVTSVLIYLVFWVHSPALADCASSKLDAEKKVHLISDQMQGASICKSNRLTITVLEINIEYLDSCPSADPDGSVRKTILNHLDDAKNVVVTYCS